MQMTLPGILPNRFDEIRFMNKYELRRFIKENRSIQLIFKSRSKYSRDQQLLSSKVLYAKNRLRTMGGK